MFEKEIPAQVTYVGTTQSRADQTFHFKQFFLVTFGALSEGRRKKAWPVLSLGKVDEELTYFLSTFNRKTWDYTYLPNKAKGKERTCVPAWLIPHLEAARAAHQVKVDEVVKAREAWKEEKVAVTFVGEVPSGHPSDPSSTLFFDVLFKERPEEDKNRKRGVYVRSDGYRKIDFKEGARFLKRLNRTRLIHSTGYGIIDDGHIAYEQSKTPAWLGRHLKKSYDAHWDLVKEPKTPAQRAKRALLLKPAFEAT